MWMDNIWWTITQNICGLQNSENRIKCCESQWRQWKLLVWSIDLYSTWRLANQSKVIIIDNENRRSRCVAYVHTEGLSQLQCTVFKGKELLNLIHNSLIWRRLDRETWNAWTFHAVVSKFLQGFCETNEINSIRLSDFKEVENGIPCTYLTCFAFSFSNSEYQGN